MSDSAHTDRDRIVRGWSNAQQVSVYVGLSHEPKPSAQRPSLGDLEAVRPQPDGQLSQCGERPKGCLGIGTRLLASRVHAQEPCSTVMGDVEPGRDPRPLKEGHDVVAVDPLGRGDLELQTVVHPPEVGETRAVED